MIWNFKFEDLGLSIIFTTLEITLIMINYWIKVKATSGNEDKAVRLILNFSEINKVF